MSEKPYTARNGKRVYRGLVAAGLLLAGTAGAYDVDNMVDPSAWLDGYAGGDDYRFPPSGGLGFADPGYAFTAVYDGYGYPGYGLRDYGGSGYDYSGHGYSGYGNPGYGGYGPVTRGYYSPAYPGAPDSTAAADRAYIRQLEERIRKLENANKQSLPAFGEQLSSPALPSFNAAQPVYEAPAAGQFGQPNYPGKASPRGSHSEYPTYQPSYGSQPMYQFRQ
jgi:hypothetical protein